MNVLSVQSHVVHGIVGNKAAVLPLMLRGCSVDPLHVCQLSNHTGYGSFRGSRLSGTEFDDVVAGLRNIGVLADYDVLLTGYVGRQDALNSVVQLVAELKAGDGRTRGPLLYVCDPVLGDDGTLYVPQTLVSTYQSLVASADAVTPNGFEASVLTGIEATDVASAELCCDWFHERGVRLVVITSLVPTAAADDDAVLIFASLRLSSGGEAWRVAIRVPKIEGKFSGTGDLLSALVVADLRIALGAPHAGEFERLVLRWCNVLNEVLRRTEVSRRKTASDAEASAAATRFTELRLVDCIDLLSNPTAGADGVATVVGRR